MTCSLPWATISIKSNEREGRFVDCHVYQLQEPLTLANRFGSDPNNCPLCRFLRRFLFVAAFLLVAIWAQPDWALAPGVDYGALVGDGFALIFVIVLVWKALAYRKEKRQGKHDDGLTWMGTSRRPSPRSKAPDSPSSPALTQASPSTPAEPEVKHGP